MPSRRLGMPPKGLEACLLLKSYMLPVCPVTQKIAESVNGLYLVIANIHIFFFLLHQGKANLSVPLPL